MSPAEYQAVADAARRLGIPLTVFLRRAALAAARRVEATALDDLGDPIFADNDGAPAFHRVGAGGRTDARGAAPGATDNQ